MDDLSIRKALFRAFVDHRIQKTSAFPLGPCGAFLRARCFSRKRWALTLLTAGRNTHRIRGFRDCAASDMLHSTMQDESQSGSATQVLLQRWRGGDTAAGNELAELVYGNLRRLANSYMRNERPSHTLTPTALVHEAYVRLAGSPLSGEDRAHFLALAAREMRHVLVDHARTRNRDKRGGGLWQKVTLDEAHRISTESTIDMLVLQAALDRLSEVDPRKAQLVDLICFGGLKVEEAASVLQVSTATVGREWRMARAWLQHELKHDGPGC